MKFILRGENQNPDVGDVGVFAATAGLRCDAIQLTLKDVMALHREATSPSAVRREAVGQLFGYWLTKFVPEK